MKIISTALKSSFAYFTLVNRIPKIISDLIKHYQLSEDSGLAELLKSIPHEKLTPVGDYPDCPSQRKIYFEEINDEIQKSGYRWDNCPFFLLENYLYHKICELLRKEGIAEDHFSSIKNSAADDAVDNLIATYHQYGELLQEDKKRQIQHLLKLNLLGNKADLSQSKATYSQSTRNNKILIDHTERIIPHLDTLTRVDIILDNAGVELFADLILAHWLIKSTPATEVVLHFKTMPYFVSDALISDFDYLIQLLKANDSLRSFAVDIESLLDQGQLKLAENEFWSSANIFRNLPDKLRDELSNSDLLVFKGDLNYRKLVEDRMWDVQTETEKIINYLPANSLILRVLKSEVIIGLGEDNIPSKTDNSWRYNGNFSMIGFVERGVRKKRGKNEFSPL